MVMLVMLATSPCIASLAVCSLGCTATTRALQCNESFTVLAWPPDHLVTVALLHSTSHALASISAFACSA